MLNVYVVERADKWDYDDIDQQIVEQVIVAPSSERAITLASKEYGEWSIRLVVDLDVEQILTTSWNWG